MGHHYIPQKYLRMFSERNEQIWCYEKGTGRVFLSNIKNVAQENKLYSHELEASFQKEIEDPCIPAFEKISTKEILNDDDKKKLSAYVFSLLIRKPINRNEAKEWLNDKRRSEIMANVKKDYLNLIKQQPSLSDKVYKAMLELEKIDPGS